MLFGRKKVNSNDLLNYKQFLKIYSKCMQEAIRLEIHDIDDFAVMINTRLYDYYFKKCCVTITNID